jgi:DNA-binding transcriptional ArsR family regulator
MRRLSDDLFLAIAHPVRREILEALAEADSVPVADLQVRTGLSASALSQHLAVLRSAGLVQDEKQGRKVSYRLTPEPLLEVISWMLRFQETWASRLDALGRYLDEGGLQDDGPENKRRP